MSRAGRSVAPAILAALVAALPASAERPPERTLSPYFFVEEGDPAIDRLPLLGTAVEVDVAGVIADVRVRQTYRNEGQRPIHARYVFPASTRAAVHGLSLTVGSEVVRAVIRERELARLEFLAAKREGRNAALLEQQRPNVFTMEIANLVPGEQVEVELHYSELLVPEDGVYEFVYPTVVGPRYSTAAEGGVPPSERCLATPYLREGAEPATTFALAGTIRAGMPIEGLESPSHRLETSWEGRTRARFELDPVGGAGGDRDLLLRYRLRGGAIETGLLLHATEERAPADESFFLLMLQPPRVAALDQVPPREYVFVVDVSGSMDGFPLETARALLRDLIGGLRPYDTFNVLLFESGSQLWSPDSQPATGANVEDAIALFDEQRGGGGTELLAALAQAMALPGEEGVARSVVVITDGFITAEAEVFAHVRQNLDRASVFAFGIGRSVNRHLIEGIARAGLGEPFVVSSEAEAGEVATRFRRYVELPLLTDIAVAFEGFEAYDVEPAKIPDLLADRPIVIQGKWRGEPSGRIVVSGTGGQGPYRQVIEVGAARPDPTLGALRTLWARTRVAHLGDLGLASETDGLRQQIVELGLAYDLLTRYTSFIAVRETVRNLEDAAEVDHPSPLPAGVNDHAGGIAVGSEPGLFPLALTTLAAGIGLAWLRRRRAASAGFPP